MDRDSLFFDRSPEGARPCKNEGVSTRREGRERLLRFRRVLRRDEEGERERRASPDDGFGGARSSHQASETLRYGETET